MELENGEIICDRCNGSIVDPDQDFGPQYSFDWGCKKCNGTGKLNWIQNVIGIENRVSIIFK